MRLAILGAMPEEISPLLNVLKDYEKVEYANNTYYISSYKNHELILAYSKIGKVNSSLSAAAGLLPVRQAVGQGAQHLLLLPLTRQGIVGGGQGIVLQPVGRLGPQSLIQRLGGAHPLQLGNALLFGLGQAALSPGRRGLRGGVAPAAVAHAGHELLQLRHVEGLAGGGVDVEGVGVLRQPAEHGGGAALLPHVLQPQASSSFWAAA